MRRTQRHLRRDGADHATVFVFLRGRGTLERGGRLLDGIAPGEVVLQDSGQPLTMASAGDFRELRLAVPRPAFAARVGKIETLAGLRAPADAPLTRLFTRYLADYGAALPARSAEDAAVGLDGVLHLLSGLVDRTLSSRRDGGERTSPGALLAMADRHIASHLADAGLDAAALARALGVSRSRLYAGFAGRGGVSAAIRNARLDRAKRLIAAPAHRRQTLEPIAFGCGLTDCPGFSRAFRARFGLSPRDLRDG